MSTHTTGTHEAVSGAPTAAAEHVVATQYRTAVVHGGPTALRRPYGRAEWCELGGKRRREHLVEMVALALQAGAPESDVEGFIRETALPESVPTTQPRLGLDLGAATLASFRAEADRLVRATYSREIAHGVYAPLADMPVADWQMLTPSKRKRRLVARTYRSLVDAELERRGIPKGGLPADVTGRPGQGRS